MRIAQLLETAGVPTHLWPEAVSSLQSARAAHGWSLGWMTLRKHFARINGRWVQGWYPLPTHELRACVVWMRHPIWQQGA